MMLLLAIGIGLGVMGLIAIAIAIPIVDSSLGNGLLISGVTVTCSGFLLVGLGLAVRDLKKALAGAPLGEADVHPVTVKARASANPLFPPQPGHSSQAGAAISAPAEAPQPAGPAEPPSWAEDAASRGGVHPSAPEVAVPPPAPAVEPPAAPPQPERPARRNLLFSIKRRDKTESESAPVPKTALESEPAVSFENAWPQSPRAELEPRRTAAAPDIRPGAQPLADAPADGLTVVKSGVVDGMSYTLFSDGSIEARLPGEDPIRFGSLDALRTYLDQRQ